MFCFFCIFLSENVNMELIFPVRALTVLSSAALIDGHCHLILAVDFGNCRRI